MNTVCPNCGVLGNNFSCRNHMSYMGVNPQLDLVPPPQSSVSWINTTNTELFAEIGRLNVLLNKRQEEIERLKGLMPPDERGPGFVGQGSWSVFAEKVVEERDALREELAEKDKQLKDAHLTNAWNSKVIEGFYNLIKDLREKGIIDVFNRPLPLEGHHRDCGHGKDGWSMCTCDELKKEGQPVVDWRQELKKGDEVRFCLDGLVTAAHHAVKGAPVGQVAVRESVHGKTFHLGTDQVIKKLGS